jgi:catalase
MKGFSSHTYKWVNAAGEGYWIKLHYLSDAGIKNFTRQEAGETTGRDADHATRDLFNHIASGKVASWYHYSHTFYVSFPLRMLAANIEFVAWLFVGLPMCK